MVSSQEVDRTEPSAVVQVGVAEDPTSTPSGQSQDRTFLVWVGTLTALQLLLRGWAAAGGWFVADDFWWHDIVGRNGVWETMGMSLGGHYSPLTYLPYWLVTAAAPYDWAVRVCVMLVTLLGVNLGVLFLVRRLWSDRRPQIAVYGLWCFSTLAAPSWLWYSQFSMLGALLLGSTWTLWAFVRAIQTGARTHTWAAVTLLVVSLLTQERMLVSAVLILAFCLLVADSSRAPAQIARDHIRLWVGSGVAVLVYLLVYRSVVVEAPGSVLPSASDALGIIARSLSISAIPSLLGGPWVLDGTPVLGRAGTPGVLQVLALSILLTLMAVSIRVNRQAWRAWSVLALGLVADAGLIVLGRGVSLAGAAVTEWRYFSDLAVLAPVLLVAAFVTPGSAPHLSAPLRRLLWGLLAACVAGTMLTTVQLGTRWHRSESRQFVQTAISGFEAYPDAAVMDRLVPETVVHPILGQQRFASRVFSIVVSPSIFDQASASPIWIDDDGQFVPADVVDARLSLPTYGCGYELRGTEPAAVPIGGDPDFYTWGVRIDYTVDRDTRASVSAGGGVRDVELTSGTGSVFVPLPGAYSEVRIFLTDPSATGCVRQVAVGDAGPRG